jgi:DNA-binding GntR family transcriptional regulator
MTTANTPPSFTQSLADRAYQEIRAMILDLRLLPGQTLLIDELAEQLGMSRTPVREAITRLSMGLEGLLETVPRKGIVVTIPSVDGMREIYEIIHGLEGEAVRLAVERIDEAMLQELEAAVTAQEEVLAKGELYAWTQADRKFHHLLVDAAKNRRLRDLVHMFDGQLHRTRVATVRLRSTAELAQSTLDHRAILEALRARDVEQVLKVHTTHRERALRDMVQMVADYSSALVLRATAQATDNKIAMPVDGRGV